MITEEPSIKCWSDLSNLVEQHFKKGLIYRGVRQSAYTLRPSVGREGARRDVNGINLPYDVEEERRQLRQFKREARKEVDWEPRTDLEWMVLGQHHRLPTRLLDWTYSLMVAAFFAVEDPRYEAAIYGVEPPAEIDDLAIDPFGNQLGEKPRLIKPRHISRRITAQQGVLTLHPKPDEDWVTEGMHRWRIPKESTFTLKGILDFSGVHAASMFPDSADRHTEHLAWLYKRGRLT